MHCLQQQHPQIIDCVKLALNENYSLLAAVVFCSFCSSLAGHKIRAVKLLMIAHLRISDRAVQGICVLIFDPR